MKREFEQLDPCLARGAWHDSFFEDTEHYFEEKLDGDRRVGQFCDGTVRFTGRRVSDVTGLLVEKTDNVPHITRSFGAGTLTPKSDKLWTGKIDRGLMKRTHLLDGTGLDGENVISQAWLDAIVASGIKIGGLSKYCTKIMGCDPGKAVKRQREYGFMRWVIFDCLFYKGKDLRALPQMERSGYAREVVGSWANPFVTMAPFEALPSKKRAFLDAILARPFGEGVIAKLDSAKYGEQSKWSKLKFVKTYDVIIVGYEAPEEFSEKVGGEVSRTKFFEKGWIGAVKFGQYRDGKLWDCGTMSGMDEELREELSRNGKQYIGRVVEVEANGREPTGKFRHPRFNRWRSDKKAADCKYDPNES